MLAQAKSKVWLAIRGVLKLGDKMNRKQYCFLLMACTTMSLLGGALASFFFIGANPANAQQSNVIRAMRLEIVDTYGNVKASLGYESVGAFLNLVGRDCGIQVTAGKGGKSALKIWEKSSNGTCTTLLDASALIFYDVDGELRSVFRQPYDKYQNSFIVFMDRARNVVWEANLSTR